MGERIVIESPAPPEAVLAAIREDSREWRESVIPPALRRELRFRVETGAKGDRFWLQLPSSAEAPEQVTLRGKVSPAPGGGSVIRATFQSGSADFWPVVGTVGIAVAFWSLSGGLAMIAAAAAFGGLDRLHDSRLGRETSPTAAYLDQRLRAAIVRAAEPGAAAPATPSRVTPPPPG